jgi:trimethylamine:corrinoid methyltransferase-like protein
MLSHPHTRRHWRQELSIPSRWVDRASYGDWQAAGARSAVERAREEVERHLAAPSAPLSGAPAEALEALLAADAERSGVGRLPVF